MHVSMASSLAPSALHSPLCRRDLWDVAFSGPLVGGLASLALLLAGYYASSPEITARELLVAVPKPLFQGSLLLGTMTKLVLPSDLLNGQEVLIHPLSIAGWCGMITTALNLLPVGCLDGGRMVQVRSAAMYLTEVVCVDDGARCHAWTTGPYALPGKTCMAKQPAPQCPTLTRCISNHITYASAPAGRLRQERAGPDVLLHLRGPGPRPAGLLPGAALWPLRAHLPARQREVHPGPGGATGHLRLHACAWLCMCLDCSCLSCGVKNCIL
jgi:hypothetical protein